MPHKCTNCKEVFPDGSEEILKGCPECGWNKFRYVKNETEETKKELEAQGKKLEREKKEVTEKKKKILDKYSVSWQRKSNNVSMKDLEKIEELGEKVISRSKELDKDSVESLRVKGDGSFDINLESLLNKNGIIISIGEEGRYLIDIDSFLE
ncbi:MAG: Zn-ribbon containing protein [Candidatus Methanohalarchaeum thermophilum]|uniref:Zn-ribbon containing protein n=1 Tax=Methanohalarchaeum thermophilum TaxID=1903181 RepID=A0A1Q6DUZ9_METT1|nr:MAG: Zn-ribbon containing protein [Candidatus Methanohalarchaeum thermophilum]